MGSDTTPVHFALCKSELSAGRLKVIGPAWRLPSVNSITKPSFRLFHTTQGEFENEVSIWRRNKCFPSTLNRRTKIRGFILRKNIFLPHFRRSNIKTKEMADHVGLVFEENLVSEITWLSRRHRFCKAPFSKRFRQHENTKTAFCKFFRFEERFRTRYAFHLVLFDFCTQCDLSTTNLQQQH